MKFTRDNNQYIIRIDKDEELVEKLLVFCREQNINSAVFSGIGSVLSAEIGFYDLSTKQYFFKELKKPLEIVSLTGSISEVDGSPFAHMHAVLSNENFECFGGHLKNAVVGATCEIYLKKLEVKISRKQNDEIGLKLLDLESVS